MNSGSPDWHVLDLQPGLQVRAMRPMPELAPAVEAQVASIWAQQRETRPRLFNGVVFSADRITAGRIEGHWTEYRRVLAQLRSHGLFEALGLRALAVNGLLECADGLVLGRREPGSVYQPGGWQSPPAGSVERRSENFPTGGSTHDEPIDLAAQVLAECEEELGVPARDVAVLRPVVAVEHPGSHVVDIGLLLRTSLDFAQVEAAWRVGGNREYDQLRRFDPGPPLPDAELLPTTRALIAAWMHNRVVK